MGSQRTAPACAQAIQAALQEQEQPAVRSGSYLEVLLLVAEDQ